MSTYRIVKEEYPSTGKTSFYVQKKIFIFWIYETYTDQLFNIVKQNFSSKEEAEKYIKKLIKNKTKPILTYYGKIN
jgi:hypothetical protein